MEGEKKMFPRAERELEQWENVSQKSRKRVQSKIIFKDVEGIEVGVG